jgi:hypothetical protein
MHAIGGEDAQAHTFADGDFNARRLECEATRDDVDLSRCVLTRGTVDSPCRRTNKDRNRGQSYSWSS